MKKILLILSNIITPNFSHILIDQGYDVIEYTTKNDNDENIAQDIYEKLDLSYYAVWMYNYFPKIAEVCYLKSVLYISWIVDYPCFSLGSDTVRFSTNRIFSFERDQVEKTKREIGANIYYQPLGTDVSYFDSIVSHNMVKKFTNIDISFVGNLYNSVERNLYMAVRYLPEYVRGYINGIVSSQLVTSQCYINSNFFPPELERELRKYIIFNVEGYCFNYLDKIVEMIQREVSRERRCRAVSLMNKYFNFRLFTGSDTSFDKSLIKEEYIDYSTEMPLVFRNSKINLNITIDSISTAIPLRALDIMACKGFLLSDFREDLAEYFVEGKELAIYNSIEEMIDKANFYLNHDSIRKKMAQKGYEKIKKEFSLEVQLRKIISKLEELE